VANLRLQNVSKRFGTNIAVKSLDLDIRDKEFFCILGPPGAGKTTTLRLIVGLERPDEGNVYIDGKSVNKLHPGQRDIAMIFQNLALYPDKTVFNNIAFPLRERKMEKEEIRERVEEVARVLHIEPLLDRKPAKLSGGERQRVAIGRAIVRRPKAYLMDEPLANLDALLRLEMRIELKRLQNELGQTLVYVTHDQVEAMSMADRIAVMNLGILQQCDIPMTVYDRPANRFVATVVGNPPMNFLTSQWSKQDDTLEINHEVFTLKARGDAHPAVESLKQIDGQGQVLVGVRPEDIRLLETQPKDVGIPAKVSVIEPLGSENVVDVHLGSDIITVVTPPTQKLKEGQSIWAQFDLAKIHLFDVESEQRIYSAQKSDALECLGG
jgi:multiple sugar transport system ATP-binding protein